jgi:poly(A) polymerase Pap1
VLIKLSVDLPDDVFQPGEVKPTKAKKKVIKKEGTDLATKKRKLEEEEVR